MATGTSTSTPASRRVGKLTVTPISDREAELTRVFNAPRRLVFEAHSKPEHVRHWWGPRDSTMVSCEMDFRPGGAWRFVLRTADGNEAAFRGEYREIVPPERIVQTFEFEGMPGAVSLETMTLEDLGDTTRMVAVSRFDSVEALEAMLQSGMETGAAETYDRLEEHLRAMA